MSMRNLLRHLVPGQTPQSAPLSDAKTPQVANSAGGFVWAVSDRDRLDRFLILGSEGGTYYTKERKLTLQNAQAVGRCLDADGVGTVAHIAEVSRSGRAPKNTPAIFALAMALKLGDFETRRAAREAVPAVCRTGTHLFQLADAVGVFGGWGRGTQRAFSDWYNGMNAERLAYQVAKYQQRNGWSHRDILRKTHTRPANDEVDAVFRWVVKGWDDLPETAPDRAAQGFLWAVERAKDADSVDAIVGLIRQWRLPRECVPTRWLKERRVWEALLDNGGRGMPLTALVRNLGKLSAVGLVSANSAGAKAVVDALADTDRLRKSRVHPLQLLVALTTYKSGHGVRGSLSWNPVSTVVDALDSAFYTAFDNVEPTNLRWMLALDVSGSMGWGNIAGLPGITPAVGSAAMSLVTAVTEPQHAFVAFSSKMRALDISPKTRLDKVVKALSGMAFGGTDCALPMKYALRNKIPVDVFAVYTDSETWYGNTHPSKALEAYRDKMGIPAKLVVVGMTSNGFTIANPDDAGMLDVVGFDTAAPRVMRDWAVQGVSQA